MRVVLTTVLAVLLVTASPALALYQAPGEDEEMSETEDHDRHVLHLDRQPTRKLADELREVGLDIVLEQGAPLNVTAVRGSEAEVDRASSMPEVQRATLDQRYRLAGFDDPLADEQWGIHDVGMSSMLDPVQLGVPEPGTEEWVEREACEEPDGTMAHHVELRLDACVVVAVLDTGVDFTHPDLEDRQWRPQLDLAGQEEPEDRLDPRGHGTHVAGTVAATTGNGDGVASIAGNARTFVDSIQVCGAGGSCWWSAVASGIVEATDRGADVVSMSLGGPTSAPILEDAIQYAQDRGVLVVAAAGNDYGSTLSYPAAFGGVLGVTATMSNGEAAYFTSTGAAADLAAPGHVVLSTLPTYPGYTLESTIEDSSTWGFHGNGHYGTLSGTSMAAPHVAGAAAFALQILTSETCQEPEACELWTGSGPSSVGRSAALLLEATAEDRGPEGWDPTYGWGSIRVDQAWDAALEATVEEPSPGSNASLERVDVRTRDDASTYGHRAEVSASTGVLETFVGHHYADVPFVEHRPMDAVEVSVRADPAAVAALEAQAPGEGDQPAPAVHADTLFRSSAWKLEYEDEDPGAHTQCTLLRANAYSDRARTGASTGGGTCAGAFNNGFVYAEGIASASGQAGPSATGLACSTLDGAPEDACDRSSLPRRLAGTSSYVVAGTSPDACLFGGVQAGEEFALEETPPCAFLDVILEPLLESSLDPVGGMLTTLYDVRHDFRFTMGDALNATLSQLPEGLPVGSG